MRLWPDLEPHYVIYRTGIASKSHGQPGPDGTIQWGGFPSEFLHRVYTLAEAQGIWFLCPKCFVANGGARGTHSVQVTFHGRGVLDHQGAHNTEGKPTRWHVSGNGFDDLVITPSILLQGVCGWHGFVGSSGVPPGCVA